jgi:hypothetical protein
MVYINATNAASCLVKEIIQRISSCQNDEDVSYEDVAVEIEYLNDWFVEDEELDDFVDLYTKGQRDAFNKLQYAITKSNGFMIKVVPEFEELLKELSFELI